VDAPAISLEGAVVAITGAGRGIGAATAAAFAARGALVAIGDLDGDAAADAARAIGPQAQPYSVDVRTRDAFADFLGAVQDSLGPLDILVNNAGVMPLGRFLDEDDATSATTLEVNLWGVIHGMRLALPGMVARRRGHVVNVASMMGKLHVPGAAVYGASKHAVVGLSAAVRDELQGTGVTISTVLPTATQTSLVAGIPLGGLMPTAQPHQVAAAVVGTVASRRGEVAVPSWLGLVGAAAGLVPSPLIGLLRRIGGADRVLTSLDEQARAAYDDRVAGQAGERPEVS